MGYSKICPQCGAEFICPYKTERFCSRSCIQANKIKLANEKWVAKKPNKKHKLSAHQKLVHNLGMSNAGINPYRNDRY